MRRKETGVSVLVSTEIGSIVRRTAVFGGREIASTGRKTYPSNVASIVVATERFRLEWELPTSHRL
jgi:hypothetical protein